MSIKVTLGEVETQEEKPFPKLMIEKGTKNIYYFHRYGLGLPLNDPDRYCNLDGRSSVWNMSEFDDYNQPITIQNV